MSDALNTTTPLTRGLRAFARVVALSAALLLGGCSFRPAATPTPIPTPTLTAIPPTVTATTPQGPAGPLIGSPGSRRPEGTPPFQRPTDAPRLPIGGPPSTVTPAPGATAPASDGSCPDNYPIKAVQLGRVYHLQGDPLYSRARATQCFATEADAQAAGYRRAGR